MKEEFKERFAAVKTKKQMPVKQLVMGMILLFSVTLNVMLDYVTLEFDPTIYQTAAYWLRLLTTNTAVLMILFSVRGYMKDRELTTNTEILEIQKQIDDAHVQLNQSDLCTAFEDYVNNDNRRWKLNAYRNKLQRKIERCRDWRILQRRKEKLRELLSRAEAEVGFKRVRYPKVHIGVIFSRSKMAHDSDERLDAEEGWDIGRLLINKIFGILGIGVLGASLAMEQLAFAPAVIITTAIKLFQAAYAAYAGGSDGTQFACGTILTKMKLRLDYVQKFMEMHRRETRESAGAEGNVLKQNTEGTGKPACSTPAEDYKRVCGTTADTDRYE